MVLQSPQFDAVHVDLVVFLSLVHVELFKYSGSGTSEV